MGIAFRSIILTTALLVAFQHSSAQKVIKLDDNLKKSQAMKVKRKGARSIGRYEFGTYKLLSGKSGWTTSTSSKSTGLIEMESSQKKSFVFLLNDKDSVNANVGSITASKVQGSGFFAELFDLDSYVLEESKEIFMVEYNDISFGTWNMVIVAPSAVEIDDTIVPDTVTEFEGYLTDGIMKIRIEQIFEREDGKSSLLNPFKGYVFYLDNASLGAVQILPINQQFVWIDDGLDETMKGVIVTAAVSLLVRNF